jgi:hypothetical protein
MFSSKSVQLEQDKQIINVIFSIMENNYGVDLSKELKVTISSFDNASKEARAVTCIAQARIIVAYDFFWANSSRLISDSEFQTDEQMKTMLHEIYEEHVSKTFDTILSTFLNNMPKSSFSHFYKRGEFNNILSDLEAEFVKRISDIIYVNKSIVGELLLIDMLSRELLSTANCN